MGPLLFPFLAITFKLGSVSLANIFCSKNSLFLISRILAFRNLLRNLEHLKFLQRALKIPFEYEQVLTAMRSDEGKNHLHSNQVVAVVVIVAVAVVVVIVAAAVVIVVAVPAVVVVVHVNSAFFTA